MKVRFFTLGFASHVFQPRPLFLHKLVTDQPVEQLRVLLLVLFDRGHDLVGNRKQRRILVHERQLRLHESIELLTYTIRLGMQVDEFLFMHLLSFLEREVVVRIDGSGLDTVRKVGSGDEHFWTNVFTHVAAHEVIHRRCDVMVEEPFEIRVPPYMAVTRCEQTSLGREFHFEYELHVERVSGLSHIFLVL